MALGAIVYKVALYCTADAQQSGFGLTLASNQPATIVQTQAFRSEQKTFADISTDLKEQLKMEGNFLITGAAQGFGKEFTHRVLKSKYFKSLPSTSRAQYIYFFIYLMRY